MKNTMSTLSSLAQTVMLPFQRFLRQEVIGGILLLTASIAALVIANSPLGHAYEEAWKTPIGISIGEYSLVKDLHHWINEGLMALFFFLVGLEIKREVRVGELSSPRQAFLPLAAAIGGMVLPAAIYAAINAGGPGAAGWGVPMATDIAFALGCLALLGGRVPSSLIIFLLALAIIDDLGGILVIALFYSEDLSIEALLSAAVLLSTSYGMNRILGIRWTFPYVFVGILMWLALLKSGIHATIAGVLLAMTIPASTTIRHSEFVERVQEQLRIMTGQRDGNETCPLELEEEEKQNVIQSLEQTCFEAEAPLEHMEHTLHPWVVYLIVPLFAFANAGVAINFDSVGSLLGNPVFLGIVGGLVIGKPLGIFIFSWLAVKAGLTVLPNGVEWKHVAGVGCLGGIGFTMSLFIGTLAFPGNALLETCKLAIIAASALAGIAGLIILSRAKSRLGI
ncbi:MAG: Na+/H+ antiporter NhaA [Nitrospirota bacterium]|nr:Na+/H+ antiporter NhaA [Nitrospirota bacterium]